MGTEQLLPEGPWAPGSAPVGPQGLLKFLEPTQQGPPPTKQDAPTSTLGRVLVASSPWGIPRLQHVTQQVPLDESHWEQKQKPSLLSC